MLKKRVLKSVWWLVLVAALLPLCLGSLGFIIRTQPQVPEHGIAVPWLLDRYIRGQSALDEREQIAAAVDCYFEAQYESRIARKAVDLGFVVDTSSGDGMDLYNYEMGLLLYKIDCYETTQTLLDKYEYCPLHEAISVKQESALVKVSPQASVRYSHIPGESFSIGSEPHEIALIRTERGWKITADRYDTEVSRQYPRGTDFEALRTTLSSRALSAETGNKNAAPKPSTTLSPVPPPEYVDYNRSLAVQYALNHVVDDHSLYTTTNYNLKFGHYNPNDCMNFVSQCVWTGFGGQDNQEAIDSHAFPMVQGITGVTDWWGDSTTASSAWWSVPDFTTMLTNNYRYNRVGVQGTIGNLPSIDRGDVIVYNGDHIYIVNNYVDYDGDGVRDYNEVFLCAHTTNRRNDLLTEAIIDPYSAPLSYYWIVRYKS